MPYYIALIQKDADSCYGVSFPDLPSVVTAGDTIGEAMRHAAEDWESGGRKGLPSPRTIDDLRSDPDFQESAADAVVAAVPFRSQAEAAD